MLLRDIRVCTLWVYCSVLSGLALRLISLGITLLLFASGRFMRLLFKLFLYSLLVNHRANQASVRRLCRMITHGLVLLNYRRLTFNHAVRIAGMSVGTIVLPTVVFPHVVTLAVRHAGIVMNGSVANNNMAVWPEYMPEVKARANGDPTSPVKAMM